MHTSTHLRGRGEKAGEYGFEIRKIYGWFGREVERGVNGIYTGVMYTPVGKTAIMRINATGGFTTLSAYFPLPGGATYFQNGSTNGTGYFWHKDWLGSVRLSSSVLNRTCVDKLIRKWEVAAKP